MVLKNQAGHYSDIFANSISKISALDVCVPKDTTALKPGTIYIAPGDLHMTVDYRSGQLVAKIDNGQPRESYRPSVNLLFKSVAKLKSVRSLAVLLTGMGADGAKGLLAIKQKGNITIAQDKESSVVYGMPRAAAELGAAIDILPLTQIPAGIIHHLKARQGANQYEAHY